MIKNLFKIAIETATVTRYSQSKLMRDESVMEHLGSATFMAAVLGSQHPDIDHYDLMLRTITHDVEESVIGDVASPIKHDNKDIHNELNYLGKKAAKEIFNNLEADDLYNWWEAGKDATIEGRLLAIIDVLSVIMKIYEEVIIYHNYSLINHAINTGDFLEIRYKAEEDKFLKQILSEAIEINNEILERR